VVWLNYSLAWGGSYDKQCLVKELDNLAVSADVLQPFKFQGQFFDTETSFHYNRFRYYDSDVGMFVSRDPIGLMGGDNVFAYAPNPIGWIDPYGLTRQILGNYGEKWAMDALRDNSKYLSIFSVQNTSNNGLDIVAKRADGKYDIFEVKTSLCGNFKLSERQATGKGFAKTVLLGDVQGKRAYFKQGLNGLKTQISKSEARRIYQNMGDTRKIYVNACRNSKGRYTLQSMIISPW
jgi:RHS repeat-associated protein